MGIKLENDGKQKHQSITAYADIHIDLHAFGETEIDALWALHAQAAQAISDLQTISNEVMDMIEDRRKQASE